MSAPRDLAALCAAWRATHTALPRIEQALQNALDRASKLQTALHEAEDRLGEIEEEIEAAAPATGAEAAVKAAILRIMAKERTAAEAEARVLIDFVRRYDERRQAAIEVERGAAP